MHTSTIEKARKFRLRHHSQEKADGNYSHLCLFDLSHSQTHPSHLIWAPKWKLKAITNSILVDHCKLLLRQHKNENNDVTRKLDVMNFRKLCGKGKIELFSLSRRPNFHQICNLKKFEPFNFALSTLFLQTFESVRSIGISFPNCAFFLYFMSKLPSSSAAACIDFCLYP